MFELIAIIDISIYFPQDKQSLLQISGFSERTYNLYGSQFLEIIQKYCQENSIKSKSIRTFEELEFDMSLPEHTRIGDAFNRGSSPEEISQKLNITLGEVYDFLYKYINDGNKLKHIEFYFKSIKNKVLVEKALALLYEHGHYSLKPIYLKLGEKITMDELKIIRLRYINQRSKIKKRD